MKFTTAAYAEYPKMIYQFPGSKVGVVVKSEAEETALREQWFEASRAEREEAERTALQQEADRQAQIDAVKASRPSVEEMRRMVAEADAAAGNPTQTPGGAPLPERKPLTT
jgi:hydroxypyruvate isomerase